MDTKGHEKFKNTGIGDIAAIARQHCLPIPRVTFSGQTHSLGAKSKP
jgi:hypothetical protein